MSILEAAERSLEHVQPLRISGAVEAMRGLSLLVRDLPLSIGAMVSVERSLASGEEPAMGEVVGFESGRSVVMLYSAAVGIAPGARVIGEQPSQTVRVGRALLGRVINALGEPIDSCGVVPDTIPKLLHVPPTPALRRQPITQPLPTGVRCIDAMLTLGKGQRVGIFSGPGVGKSTLLANMARDASADVNVIALIGERGREVREFIQSSLDDSGLAKSVIIVATGDESPLLRVRAALVSCAIAEYFRDLGLDVMLFMDSITRFAQAQRQIGLTVGEPPATKGYTPSVFAMLPALLERAGSLQDGGSITGLYAVLVEGDDLAEPISDAARGILDGHIALSRRFASRGHFPAIDPLDSISRVADVVCDEHHIRARRTVLRLLAAYSAAEELINIGAYAHGSDADCDVAIALRPAITEFLRQESRMRAPYPETCRRLIELAEAANAEYARRPTNQMRTTAVGVR